jgi:hypothetical protein
MQKNSKGNCSLIAKLKLDEEGFALRRDEAM